MGRVLDPPHGLFHSAGLKILHIEKIGKPAEQGGVLPRLIDGRHTFEGVALRQLLFQQHAHGGAGPLGALHQNRAAMLFRDSKRNGKPEARTARLRGGETLHGIAPKDRGQLVRRDAAAGVIHGEIDPVLAGGQPRTEDAITNFGLPDDAIEVIDMEKDSLALSELTGFNFIVDAIYGTGFRGELTGDGLKAALFINKAKEEGATVFALDIPSGLSGDMTDSSELDKNAVRADYTITFHARKPIHLQGFADDYCGQTIVADIGIDEKQLWN